MATKDQEHLAKALETLATQIASAPRTVIGMKVSATAGPGSSGDVTGLKVVAVGGQAGGTTIGAQAIAVAGADPANDLIQEIRDAAAATREGKGNKSWFESLLKRANDLTDRTIAGAVIAAAQEAVKAYFSS